MGAVLPRVVSFGNFRFSLSYDYVFCALGCRSPGCSLLSCYFDLSDLVLFLLICPFGLCELVPVLLICPYVSLFCFCPAVLSLCLPVLHLSF